MDGTPAGPVFAAADLLAMLDHLGCLFPSPLEAIRDQFPAADMAGQDEERREFALTIVGLCDELIDLTRGFAECAAILSGARPDDQVPARLSTMAAEVDRSFVARVAARKIRWSSRLLGHDATVLVDPARFRQVVAHVVAFGINATPAGGGLDFEIGCDATCWTWAVSGIGPGFPDESIGVAFAPLLRLAEAPARDGQDDPSGCGLAFCRPILDPIGGRIGSEVAADGTRRIAVQLPRLSP